MLEAVKLPAGVADLATSLPNVDGDALTLWERKVTVRAEGVQERQGQGDWEVNNLYPHQC